MIVMKTQYYRPYGKTINNTERAIDNRPYDNSATWHLFFIGVADLLRLWILHGCYKFP